jgi:hypothetical protein
MRSGSPTYADTARTSWAHFPDIEPKLHTSRTKSDISDRILSRKYGHGIVEVIVLTMTGDAMARLWEADPGARFARRLGRSAHELGDTKEDITCPDLWELSNGDVAAIGRDLTEAYRDRLPSGVSVGPDERIVILPRNLIIAAKPDIPDA